MTKATIKNIAHRTLYRNEIFQRRVGIYVLRVSDWSVIHAQLSIYFAGCITRITPPEPEVKGLRAAVRGAPMNGGLAAALDIHPRRRYTAHKAAVG